jgi:acetyl-CoA carboxylase carboxyltransferase component
MRAAVHAQIEAQSAALAMSGRGYDDGVIDPRHTRTVLGLCLWLISRRPHPGSHGGAGYGVFRM